MKKTILLTAIILSAAATIFAQHQHHGGTTDTTAGKSQHQMDCCMMQQGKMTCMMMGKMSPMEKDMMMQDSSIVKPDGTVIRRNGEKIRLRDGMCCDMMGNVHESCVHQQIRKRDKQKAYYVCPMHPDETADKPVKCPKCGMMLKEQK
jgi:hypothetical protein